MLFCILLPPFLSTEKEILEKKEEEEEKEKDITLKSTTKRRDHNHTRPPRLNTLDVGQKHKPLQEVYWIHVTRKEPTTITEMARLYHARRPCTDPPVPFIFKQCSPSVGRSYEPKPFDCDA